MASSLFSSAPVRCGWLRPARTIYGAMLDQTIFVRWKKKASAGTVSNTHDSIGKRLGLKKRHGQYVRPGHIIIRQRGTTYHPGENVVLGKDHTINAVAEGVVHISAVPRLRATNYKRSHKKERKFISVIPKPTQSAFARALLSPSSSSSSSTTTSAHRI